MGDKYDADQVLVSFTIVWVCTIAYYTDYIHGSRFMKVPFACGHIYSLRTPEDEITEGELTDIVDARHRKLYSWLSTRATNELTGNEDKCMILWFVEEDADASPRIAYVVEFVRCDECEQNDDMIRKRASNILKSVQVCCLTDDMSEELRLDLEVWKGAHIHGNVEEFRKERRVIEHGSFRVGYFEFRCWMVR